MPEDVVLAEVRVHEAAALVQHADDPHQLLVGRAQLGLREVGVLEPRGRDALRSDKVHDEHVGAEEHRLGCPDAGGAKAGEVAHLLLSPNLDHLAGVALPVAPAESAVAGDVRVAVSEDEDRRLIHLDGHVAGVRVGAVVDVCLLARGDASVDLREDAAVEHLEEDDPCAGIERLLDRRPVRLVRHPAAGGGLLAVVGLDDVGNAPRESHAGVHGVANDAARAHLPLELRQLVCSGLHMTRRRSYAPRTTLSVRAEPAPVTANTLSTPEFNIILQFSKLEFSSKVVVT
mmetsp:Transcript_25148/g.59898  ORF Transcript_25148/g.59898 Transcript_25148/m.59898 type:complete len:288 (-) Transcript_25148:407-1270(-)